MHSRTGGFQVVLFVGLAAGLVSGLVLLMSGLLSTPASAESVPFNCTILPGAEMASIMMTNSLASDASCIVTCKFSTTKYDNNPQITCAKPVPAGKEVEMCRLPDGGDRLVKLTEGHAECTRYQRRD
jgi:hypothetical protein